MTPAFKAYIEGWLKKAEHALPLVQKTIGNFIATVLSEAEG